MTKQHLATAYNVARTPFVLAFAVALMLLVLLSAPKEAHAETPFTIDELSTELTVNTNSSVHVVARQVLNYYAPNSGYTWFLYQPGEWESVRINSIRVVEVDDGGTPLSNWTRLQMIDVDADEQGKWPGDSASLSLRRKTTQPWYSYDLWTGMVRSYFPAEQGMYLIEADYTISNYVRVYRDIAELTWRYAHGSVPVDRNDVFLQVVLPVPEGALIEPGENIIAWGHGPTDGRFEVLTDGSVVYMVDYLPQGDYSDAHIIFPASWMTSMVSNAPHLYTELHKQEVLEGEGNWVDAALRRANWDNQVRMVFLAIAIIILLVGLIIVWRLGMTWRARRALIRLAAMLAIEAVAVQLFFQEPLTVGILVAMAVVIAIVALLFPQFEPDKEVSHDDEE